MKKAKKTKTSSFVKEAGQLFDLFMKELFPKSPQPPKAQAPACTCETVFVFVPVQKKHKGVIRRFFKWLW